MRRSPLLLVVLAWVVAGPALAADHAVEITGNRFEPAYVEIAPGDRVTWTNRDLNRHRVIADNGSFHSPEMLPTDQWGTAFTAPGRYPYHCELHPSMKAVVVVRAASSTSSSTTSTTRRSATTLPPEGSAVTAPGETTTTTVEETTTTTEPETTTTTADLGDDLATASDAGDDDTSTGVAAAFASLLLLGVAGGALFQVRRGALG